MTHRQKTRYIVAAMLVCLTASPAWAGPFSELVVFGDSLSDIGNVAEASLGLQPGRFYFDGRFSNGPVYAELLAEHLELGPLRASAAGGKNFAHGGAQTADTGFFAGIVIDDLDDQVDDFLSAGPADPNALLVVFAGANDLFNGETNVSVPVGNLVNDLERLVDGQARNLLVMNLPLLGTTPRFNRDADAAATMNALTVDFNAELSSALDNLAASHPDVQFFRLDVAGVISEGIADPAAFGLINVVDPAAPGLESGRIFYNSNRIAADSNNYLFWDEIHPTATAHAALAERALAAVRTPADFDFDGDVDFDDLWQWKGDFGLNASSDADRDGDSDGADFLAWQQFVEVPSTSAVGTAPEPATRVLLISVAVAGMLRRSRNAALVERAAESTGRLTTSRLGSVSPESLAPVTNRR